MAKSITVKYTYIQYEPGDKLIANYDVGDLRFTDGEIKKGTIVIVRGWEKAVVRFPDVVFLEGYEGAYRADHFSLHPNSIIIDNVLEF